MNIDMHVHTTASDGILNPSEIVDWGVKLHLRGVAITDHDTVNGIQEAIVRSKIHKNFIVIPGIEFSTQYLGHEVHILGYFVDHSDQNLLHLTQKIQKSRVERGENMINKLKRLGYNVTFEEVLSLAGNGAVGRPHIARLLVQKGYVQTTTEAFERLIGRGKRAFVERFKLIPEEAIQAIKDAGGVPVLAHPGLIHQSIPIRTLIEKGIEGIEVYHTKHTERDVTRFLKLANTLDLFITGGSDYHDDFISGQPTLGSVSISYEKIESLMERKFI